MQKKNNVEIMHHIQNMKHLKKNNFLFIGMLVFILLFQHFAFPALKQTFGFINLNTGTFSNSYFEKSSIDYKNNQIDLFLESESEDEDEFHDAQVYSKASFSNHCNYSTHHYSVFINTLYLRLVFLNQHKVDLPFFILYHSWKSYLA